MSDVSSGAATVPGSITAAGAAARPKSRRSCEGLVISAKMQKTIVVEVGRLEKHARYGKYIRRSTICKVHDEKGEAKEGDRVRIVQTRPLSKTKSWRLLAVIAKKQS